MKKVWSSSVNIIRVILFIGALFFCLQGNAQVTPPQLQMQDLVLYAGAGGTGATVPASPGYGIQLASSCNITGGSSASLKLIKTTNGQVFFNGNLYCGGTIALTNGNTVTGKVTAANSANLTGTIFSTGSGVAIGGNVDVKGNIVIAGGTVAGIVTHPVSTTYSGPVPGGGNITGLPTLPVFPASPVITVFPAAGATNISTTQSISPGSYNNMTLSGNKTITFNGPGIYVFNSISNTGNSNNFIFNFQGSATGVFRIYVHGNAIVAKASSNMINGGSASRIYLETHGTGVGGYSFNLSNGSPSGDHSRWLGTVWATHAAINIGSGNGNADLTGSLWSRTQINIQSGVTLNFAPFLDCGPVNADAGLDKQLNVFTTTKLQGSSTTIGAQFSWQPYLGGNIVAGQSTASPDVNAIGKYVLSVTNTLNPGCTATDTTIVYGKVKNIIWSELRSLYLSRDTTSDLSKSLFLIRNGCVLIDIIAIEGKYNELKPILLDPFFGLRDTITNGENSLIITGWYPIDNLMRLDSLNYFRIQNNLQALINHCRPVFPPLGKSGIIETGGDLSMRTNEVRNQYGLLGEGIRIGVMSDSYNTQPDDKATRDVENGDLPGPGNPVNSYPVHVLQDYPFGKRSDEGRAMLQVIHDVAPKAKLSFKTGFLTAGHFALGIKDLAFDTCVVIVDDITFITEPFFRPGVVSKAIKEVSDQGVHYVTAAGNFASKSYESILQPVAPPPLLTGRAHNFGSGDVLQNDSIKGTALIPGIYTIVLQWEDDIYSLGGSQNGTVNDLDIYLVDNLGNTFGVNRDNIGQDPMEILPFVVSSNTTTNIMIVNSSAPPNQTSSNLRFKYVVFRGDLKINTHIQGSATIVGQGNTPEAITVGASLYTNTPAYGVSPPTLSSYSSTGGTMYNNSPAAKPNLVGPSGINTSVSFGSIDYEADGTPNFFGTSAAAPHVAAAAALVLEGKKLFYNETMSPADLKQLLESTCIDMDAAGFDYSTGYGFINAEAALKTFARAKPQLIKLELGDSSLVPGAQTMDLLVHGKYFSPNTKIMMGNDTLPAVILNSTDANAQLPVFQGQQFIRAYTKPQGTTGADAGFSNSLPISGIQRLNITVKANNTAKKYGESLPDFTVTILVNGDSIQHTSLTAADLGLTNITYQTNANSFSSVGQYFIRPSRPFDLSDEADLNLLALYNYTFVDGAITIIKLHVTVDPHDKTITYGQPLGDVTFDYDFDETNIANPDSLTNLIRIYHEGYLSDNALAVLNGFNLPQSDGSFLSEADLANMTMMSSFNAVKNGRKYIVVNGLLVPAPENSELFNLQYYVDLSAKSIFNYKTNPQEASLETSLPGYHSRALLSTNALSNNSATINTSNGAVQMVNGTIVQMVNSTDGPLAPIFNGSIVQVVNGTVVQVVNGVFVPISNAGIVQVVNGGVVQIVNGVVTPLSNGTIVQMVNGSIVQVVNAGIVQIVNGEQVPLINATAVQYVNGTWVDGNNNQPLPNGSLVQMPNGTIVQVVNGGIVQVVNGGIVQVVNGGIVQVVNGGIVQVVNSEAVSLGSNNKTAVITDQDDVTLPKGWLGPMFGINMISGLEPGPQFLVPGILINENLEVTYDHAIVNILPPPPTCRNCCGAPVIVDQNVTINFNTNPPTYTGDADLFPFVSYSKTGILADQWKANINLGTRKLIVKSGATITTSQVSGAAPGIFIKGECDVEIENGGHIVVLSTNKNAGNLDIQVKGNITVNGEVRNEVNGTLGLPGSINIFSQCGNMNVGQTGQVYALGIDPGSNGITLLTCGEASVPVVCGQTVDNNAGLDGTITINGLVKAYAHAHTPPLTEHRPDIKVISLNGAINVNANTAEPLYDEFSSAGARFDVYGGILSWVRDNVNPGSIWIQAKKDITVRGHGTDPTGTIQRSFGAIAAIATASNSPGGSIDVRSTEGKIIASDRAFDVAGRNALPALFAHINLEAKGDINISRIGSSIIFNPVLDASCPNAGGRGGINDIRSYTGSINIGANAIVSGFVNGGGGTPGINRLVSCLGVNNLGTITPADLNNTDNTGTCSLLAPSILFPECLDMNTPAKNYYTSIPAETPRIPVKTILLQSYPNPFNHTTTIRYDLSKTEKVVLRVFNMSGKEIATLVNENQGIGEHQVTWDRGSLSGGLYYVLLNAGDYQGVNKLILLK